MGGDLAARVISCQKLQHKHCLVLFTGPKRHRHLNCTFRYLSVFASRVANYEHSIRLLLQHELQPSRRSVSL